MRTQKPTQTHTWRAPYKTATIGEEKAFRFLAYGETRTRQKRKDYALDCVSTCEERLHAFACVYVCRTTKPSNDTQHSSSQLQRGKHTSAHARVYEIISIYLGDREEYG